MSWRIFGIVTACALVAGTGAATAAEPRLSDAQLDSITAGAILGNVIGNTGAGSVSTGAIGSLIPAAEPTPETPPSTPPSSTPGVTPPGGSTGSQGFQPSFTGGGNSGAVVQSSSTFVPGVSSFTSSTVTVIQDGPGQSSTGGGSFISTLLQP